MWSQALGRAPVGSVPPKAAKGEAAAAAAQIKLGCNIQTAAGLLLQLLFEVCGRSDTARICTPACYLAEPFDHTSGTSAILWQHANLLLSCKCAPAARAFCQGLMATASSRRRGAPAAYTGAQLQAAAGPDGGGQRGAAVRDVLAAAGGGARRHAGPLSARAAAGCGVGVAAALAGPPPLCRGAARSRCPLGLAA